MPSSWLSSELPSLQQTGTANINHYHTRGPDLIEKSAKINTANYSNIENLDYYPSRQHITGCIDEKVNTTKPSSVFTPAIQRCTDGKILYSNVLGGTCTGGNYNSFLNNRQNNLRNLKGVAISIGQDQAVKDIHMLGKLYSAFSDKLRSRFDSQYPADKWAYDQFLEFLPSEITHVDSLHLMKVNSKRKDIQHKERIYGSHGRSRPQVSIRMVAAAQPPKMFFTLLLLDASIACCTLHRILTL